MAPDNMVSTKKRIVCSDCRNTIEKGSEYQFNGKILCEECCLNIRSTRMRKTHWQYIRSVKTEYLREGTFIMEATIFKTNYENYRRQIAGLEFSSIKETLGIQTRNQEAIIPFFGEEYIVSDRGIADNSGNRPDYMICVILSKYLLLCPTVAVENKEWTALKDFHKISQFTNVNVFSSDAEQPIVKSFSGRIKALSDAAHKLGGKPCELSTSYDFAMAFRALPKIDILLLFNDCDDEFPAACSVLFQRHAEEYLDPESLIMVGIAFTQRLKKLSI